jgi:hypothetical protein
MSKIKFLMSGLWAYLFPVIKVFMSDAGKVLVATAQREVAILNNSDLTSTEKKAAAIAAVTSTLSVSGYKVAGYFIQTAIETAVAKANEDKDTAKEASK